MKFVLLILANFRRHKTRTILTVLSILVAFVLFGYLAAIRKAFEMGVTVAGADRLVVRHKVSIIQLLPANYEQQIERIAGVTEATPATWFGGMYKDERVPFPRIAVKHDEYFRMFDEFAVPPDQLEAWQRTRTGVIVGRKLAERYGFKVGDKVQIRPNIWRPARGETWEFDVVGIYDGKREEADTSQMLIRGDYLE